MSLQEWLAPAVMTALIAALGYLLNRSISQLDEKVTSTATCVEGMKLDMSGYAKLVEYQKEQLALQAQEIKSLHHSVGVFDKFIAVQVAIGKLHPVDQATSYTQPS